VTITNMPGVHFVQQQASHALKIGENRIEKITVSIQIDSRVRS